MAAQDIPTELLCAESKGVTLVETFVRERLESKTVPFFAPIKKKKEDIWNPVQVCHGQQNEREENSQGRSQTYATIVQCLSGRSQSGDQ